MRYLTLLLLSIFLLSCSKDTETCDCEVINKREYWRSGKAMIFQAYDLPYNTTDCLVEIESFKLQEVEVLGPNTEMRYLTKIKCY